MNSHAENNTNDESNNKPPRRKRGGLFVIAFMIIGMVLLSRHDAVTTIDCTPEIMATKPDIVMLGAWWCTYCYQAKKYFQKENIHYCEYDMENTIEGKRLYEKHGSGPVPVLLIGEYQINGFSEQRIDQALATLK